MAHFLESRGSGLFVDWLARPAPWLASSGRPSSSIPDDPRGPELLKIMQEASDMFCALWGEGRISGFISSRKKIRHSRFGRIDHDYMKLVDAGDE